jgi:hypothetical protein
LGTNSAGFSADVRVGLADASENEISVYFQPKRSADLEVKMISQALKTLEGSETQAFSNRLKALQDANTTPQDPGWLALYVEVCQVREGQEKMAQVNLPALRRAIEDLRVTQGDAYKNGDTYLQRLESFEKRLPDIQKGLGRGEAAALEDVRAMMALQREALLANPVLDFDEILVIRRSESSPALGCHKTGRAIVLYLVRGLTMKSCGWPTTDPGNPN